MAIFLGNLSTAELEIRVGVKFPQGLIEYMDKRHQESASDVQRDKWHCFDIPFAIVCGDMSIAEEICRQLTPMKKDFKEALEICCYGNDCD